MSFKPYTKKEKRKIKKLLKNINYQLFAWCDKCGRIPLYTFRGKCGISNLIYCSGCKEREDL